MIRTVTTITADIRAASEAGDWDRVSALYDERRCAEVDADESALWVAYGNDVIFNRADVEKEVEA